MATGSASDPPAKRRRYANEDEFVASNQWEKLYTDGRARAQADHSGGPKPALTISPAFQTYIQNHNLDPRRGTTFWNECASYWDKHKAHHKSKKNFIDTCRLVVRALRNKKSASTSMQKDKEQRVADKRTIADLSLRLQQAEANLAEQSLISDLLVCAGDAARPCQTTALSGEEAVKLLALYTPRHAVRPMANTLYECGPQSICELGALHRTPTLNSNLVIDSGTGVVIITPARKTVELPRDFFL